MKKSKIHYLLDTMYYMCLILLPAVLLVGVSINGGVSAISDLMGQYTGAFEGTDLHNTIVQVIGADGVAPLLNARTMWIADWVVLVVYATAFHLLIDCLQFIPALAHRLLEKLGGDWFE